MEYNYNKESLDKLVEYQCEIAGRYPTPEIIVEPNGLCSLSWIGNRGDLTIHFEKDNIEYTYIGYNGEVEFGILDASKQETLDSLRKRAGVMAFENKRVFDRQK